jgi:ubiquinol-cytochrome c reductase cytochrome b subunit
MTKLKHRGIELYNWIEHRLGLAKPIVEAAEHPIPASSASWWYVFGSAAMVLVVLQVVTGILLALVYVPSASQAWNSLQFLNHNLTLGWFLRAVHGWGSNFMIAIVLIHMTQVFLFGAYKFPRELTWIVGVLLLLLTLGMAFTGQVLRFHIEPCAGRGRFTGPRSSGRSHHRWSYAVPVLRTARLRDPWHPAREYRRACVDGAASGHQRVAHAGAFGSEIHL